VRNELIKQEFEQLYEAILYNVNENQTEIDQTEVNHQQFEVSEEFQSDQNDSSWTSLYELEPVNEPITYEAFLKFQPPTNETFLPQTNSTLNNKPTILHKHTHFNHLTYSNTIPTYKNILEVNEQILSPDQVHNPPFCEETGLPDKINPHTEDPHHLLPPNQYMDSHEDRNQYRAKKDSVHFEENPVTPAELDAAEDEPTPTPSSPPESPSPPPLDISQKTQSQRLRSIRKDRDIEKDGKNQGKISTRITLLGSDSRVKVQTVGFQQSPNVAASKSLVQSSLKQFPLKLSRNDLLAKKSEVRRSFDKILDTKKTVNGLQKRNETKPKTFDLFEDEFLESSPSNKTRKHRHQNETKRKEISGGDQRPSKRNRNTKQIENNSNNKFRKEKKSTNNKSKKNQRGISSNSTSELDSEGSIHDSNFSDDEDPLKMFIDQRNGKLLEDEDWINASFVTQRKK